MTAFVLPTGYGKRPRAGGSKRAHPEQSLQMHVAGLLSWLLPPEVFWTAVGHGGGGKLRGAILKGMGLKSGVPDLMLLYQGQVFFVELKSADGVLSAAQKAVHAAILLAGGRVVVCRSIDQVRSALALWHIPTRAEKPSVTALRLAGERCGDDRQQ